MSSIDQMWEKFEAHQPEADRLGYGAAWRRMCEERTEDAAENAWVAANVVSEAVWEASAAAVWAKAALSWTEFWAKRSPESEAASKVMGWDVVWAERAIEYINKAEGNS